MATSIKIILHPRVYKDGTQSVMLQCIARTPAGTTWKRRTICRVKANQFDHSSRRVKNHPNQILYNSLIAKTYNEAESLLLNWQLEEKPVDIDQLMSGNAKKVHMRTMFVEYGWKYVERAKLKNTHNTAEKYGGHIGKLAEYLGRNSDGTQKDIALDEVTEDWILHWASWLRNHGSKSENSIHRRMGFINTLFLDAIKRGYTKNNPMVFLAFKQQPVHKTKLTPEQLQQLETATLTGVQEDARNTFMLLFYAYGTRISDALTWKKTNVHRLPDGLYLVYTSIKTNSLITVRLQPKAVALVDYYLSTVSGPFLLPWLAKFEEVPTLSWQENRQRLDDQIGSKTVMVNSALKAISQQLGFPNKLTSHIARHSFATMADKRIADKRKISAALGHTKFATTEIYLAQLQQGEVNDAMDVIWQ